MKRLSIDSSSTRGFRQILIIAIALLMLGVANLSAWAQVCDVDGDADVDLNDISAIFAARNTVANGPDDPRDANGDGMITHNDARMCVLDCTLANCEIVTATNQPPVADAGTDQTVFVGDTVQLNGSGSSDPDGDALAFVWSLTAPAGSSASLSDPAAVNPSFVVDVFGSYVVQLIVNDGTVDSMPDTATISTDNSRPVADAGPDQTRRVGDRVTLDGSGSSDVDGDTLTFSWSLAPPAGSQAVLSDPTDVMPTFDVDVSGSYVARLVVNDGALDSAPDTAVITTDNSPPVADAGADQTVFVGDTVQLDGSGSSDVDGDALTFAWSFTPPAGSLSSLSDPTVVMPTFLVDVSGNYVARLVVNDGVVDSVPDATIITTGNTPPVADAGADQTVYVGDTVRLDGGGSSDVDGDALTYIWSLTTPTGSQVGLSDPTLANPTFIPDVPGTYVAQLIVNDGMVDSAPDTAAISTRNSRPLADAGPDQSGLTSDTIQLDGGGSFDVDGDSLSYQWSITSGPQGATATFSDTTIANPTLTVDVAGTYVVQLIVNDGALDSLPDTAIIDVTAARTLSIAPGSLDLFTSQSGDLTVTLSVPAGSGGQVVSLTSDNTSVATVPAGVTVAEGNTTAVFQATAGRQVGSAQIRAAAIGFGDGSATVNVAERSMGLTLDAPLVGVGRSIGGTVTLPQPAPAGGVTVSLTSSNSAAVTVAPSSITIAAGGTQAGFTVSGIAGGQSTITADATGYAQANATVGVTTSMISFGTVPTIAPGETRSLPVSLSSPAPAGGVTIVFTSSNPAVATISASVFIPEGASTPAANPQVTGILIGTIQIGATAAGYAPDTISALISLDLALTPNPLTVVETTTANMTLNLSAPAPAGGLTVNLTVDDPATATVPGSITIPAGQTSAQIPVAGVAVGNTTLHAGAANITAATAVIDVTAAPPISIADQSIGRNLQTSVYGSIGAAAPAGNLQVTITSSDPSRLLLSNSAGTMGSASITVQVNAGSTSIPTFYLQALDGPGTVTFTASAPGYATDTSTANLTPSGFYIATNGFNTTTFSADTSIGLRSVRLNDSFAYAAEQPLRAGLTVNVPIISSDASVGTVNSPVAFTGNQSRVNTSFHPLSAGTTNLSITQPAGFDIPTNLNQAITATVTAPAINFGNTAVGEGLQTTVYLSLAAAPPAATDVVLTVADPGIAVISENAAVLGGSTFTIPGVTGTNPGNVIVQGLQQGTTQLTITATGYQTRVATITVTPSGFWISTNSFGTTTFSADTTIGLRSARLDASFAYATEQPLRAGLTVNVPITSSDASVGTVNSPVAFAGNQSRVNTSFHPLSAGTTNLSITQPAGFDIPTNLNQAITATVTAPAINFGNTAVGEGLQTTVYLSLAAAPPAATDVVLTVADPGIAVISENAAVLGGSTFTIPGVTGTNPGNVIVQGLQQGTTQLTITATGYQTRVATITVTPSGFWISTNSFGTTTFSADTTIGLRSARLDASFAYATEQPLRAGLTVNVPITSSDTNVGTVVSSVTFTGNQSRVNTGFDPLVAGVTDLSITQPTGFEVPTNRSQSITATVSAPNITIGNVTVGRDLQVAATINLQSAPPTPTRVTVTVASGSTATISEDPLMAGATSLTFENVSGTNVGTIYVQGRSLGSTVITVQAAGYNDGSSSVRVDPSGFAILTNSFSVNAQAQNQNISIRSSRLDPATLNWAAEQALRGGLMVDVALTNSNPVAGTIVTNPISFGANESRINAVFDPSAAGTSIIGLTTPVGFSTPSDRQQITATVTGP